MSVQTYLLLVWRTCPATSVLALLSKLYEVTQLIHRNKCEGITEPAFPGSLSMNMKPMVLSRIPKADKLHLDV